MSDFQALYDIWDEFLKEWPPSRLATMTLDEYIKAGSTDTFSRWLDDFRLGRPGFPDSIKFGVYARASSEKVPRHPHSETHVWHESLGATAGEAFQKVRGYIVQIAALAAAGDLGGIDAFEHPGLQAVIKWKIASLYQKREQPFMVNIFTPEPLVAFTGIPASKGMAALQEATLKQRREDEGILELWRRVWETWEKEQGDTKIQTLPELVPGTPAPGNPKLKVPGIKEGDRKCLKIWQYCHDVAQRQGMAVLTPKHMKQISSQQGFNPGNAEQEMQNWKRWVTATILARLPKEPAAAAAVQKEINAQTPGICRDIWQCCHDELLKTGALPSLDKLATIPGAEREKSTLRRQRGDYAKAAWKALGNALPPHEINLAFASDQFADSEPLAPDTCVNRIYYGPPGTGKTRALIEEELKKKYGYVDGKEENPRYRFVTFHQSYGYEEFLEGLRPVLNDKSGSGEVRYEIRAGVFKELCEQARGQQQRFAMVIDEINRGNISKIFGELITLIEPDKRGMEVTLPYSDELFSVPANVDIYGTMNTADRSLALLDTALRRRFEFVPLLPDTGALAGLKVGDIDVPKMLERINERIEVLYDREHCIGHAYFMALHDDPRLETLANIFRNRILPLLEEYFFEDWHKIRLVLGDNQKPEENQFVREQEQDLSALFGNDHGLDSYTTKRRYSVQESAFDNPAAYIGIYQPAA